MYLVKMNEKKKNQDIPLKEMNLFQSKLCIKTNPKLLSTFRMNQCLPKLI